MSTKFDILAIGNAIMDVIAPISEAQLHQFNIVKSGMTLIDEQHAQRLYENFAARADLYEQAGGSAANSLVGMAQMNMRTAYIGKVAEDALGQRFRNSLHSLGIHYTTPSLKNGPATARSFIAVTPDGERSMSTFLGATRHIETQDIIPQDIAQATILYLEGYLFDAKSAKAAFMKAADIARTSHRKVALTLSDDMCVQTHRTDFMNFVDKNVDILFANESELIALYQTDNLYTALSHVSNACPVACITRSEKGSIILANNQQYDIAAITVDNFVDATGAGDQYAAGVLIGHQRGLDWPACGALGSQYAAKVITHYGARPNS